MTLATTRRRLLMGLAAASAVTLPAIAGDAPKAENPDLLKLADALPTFTNAYIEARENVEWIVAEYAPQWPVPAEEIHSYGNGSKPYQSIDGRGIQTPWGIKGHMRVPSIGTPDSFEDEHTSAMARAGRCAKTKSQRGLEQATLWAEKAQANIAPSRAYWAEVDRITALSGIEDAKAAKNGARDAFAAHVGAIMDAEALTMAGLVIKAQAMDAWANVGAFHRALHPNANKWADDMSRAIISLGERHAT